MIELTKRDQQVLEAVVSDYISSGEPVGSRTISKRYGMNVSSATIRNVMADLEELGLLAQPHTSAGESPRKRDCDSISTGSCNPGLWKIGSAR